jgi:hypothetical protein
MNTDDMSCELCKWWEPIGTTMSKGTLREFGYCMRFPPISSELNGEGIKIDTLMTLNITYCGEFTPKNRQRVSTKPNE